MPGGRQVQMLWAEHSPGGGQGRLAPWRQYFGRQVNLRLWSHFSVISVLSAGRHICPLVAELFYEQLHSSGFWQRQKALAVEYVVVKKSKEVRYTFRGRFQCHVSLSASSLTADARGHHAGRPGGRLRVL